MSTLTPEMNLQVPTIGVDSGQTWEASINANSAIIDQHNHAPGSGVPISPNGLNINSSLPFNNNQATAVQAVVFTPQSSIAALTSLYVIGNELYYNDGAGNVVKITAGGTVNATSSGIASGTATASFSSGTLVVDSAPNTPANIEAGSLLIGQNVAGSNFITLQPPAALSSGSYDITLPSIPGTPSFVTLDTSGNLSTSSGIPATQIAGGSITGSQVASATLTGGNIAASTIAGSNIAASTISGGNVAASTLQGGNMVTNINLPGTSVQSSNHNVITSNTNSGVGLCILRGVLQADINSINNITATAVISGEGWSIAGTSTGLIAFNITGPAFADQPACLVSTSIVGTSNAAAYTNAYSVTTSSFAFAFIGGESYTVQFHFMLIGQRSA